MQRGGVVDRVLGVGHADALVRTMLVEPDAYRPPVERDDADDLLDWPDVFCIRGARRLARVLHRRCAEPPGDRREHPAYGRRPTGPTPRAVVAEALGRVDADPPPGWCDTRLAVGRVLELVVAAEPVPDDAWDAAYVASLAADPAAHLHACVVAAAALCRAVDPVDPWRAWQEARRRP